jgi:hypothetical protein
VNRDDAPAILWLLIFCMAITYVYMTWAGLA